MATKNKFCPICARAATKSQSPKEHICSKNWQGSSTAMEAQIILEGFKQSVKMHSLKYINLIGDGDSSVFKRITTDKPYGLNHMVRKVECTNHLLRNYCTKLRELCVKKLSSKHKPVSAELRKALKSSVERMRMGIKTALTYHRKREIPLEEQILALEKDIRNCPYHIFGDHGKCEDYFCKGPKVGEKNYVGEMEECGLLDDILVCGNRLIHYASSLILNMNNNAAESYNSVIAKFTGGKRINFAIKNSYDIRCRAAAIKYNKNCDYISSLFRIKNKEGNTFTLKYTQKLKRQRELRLQRRKTFRESKKKRNVQPADKDYGLVEDIMSEQELEKKKDEFLRNIFQRSENIKQIEELTRGQASNHLWLQLRTQILTSSNFGIICKRRNNTDPKKLVDRLKSPQNIWTVGLQWGRDHEALARRDFEIQYKKKIDSCGLFIYKDKPFLGSSPDGLVGDEEMVEIKCPFSCSQLTPEDGIIEKKIKFMEEKNGIYKLKRKDNYYYQVQGQLNITGRKLCYFIVWTPLGMIVDKIERDDQFWKEMETKLELFYMKNMLPELVKTF